MAIKCEVCDCESIIKKDGYFECQNCGIRYTLDEIKKAFASNQTKTEETKHENETINSSESNFKENSDKAEAKDTEPISLIGKYVDFGNAHIFPENPWKRKITWQVLDEDKGRVLLFSTILLGELYFNNRKENCPLWERSDIRTFLNNEALGVLFSSEEQRGILSTELKGYLVPTTFDKLFFLSTNEVEKYFSQRGIKEVVDKYPNYPFNYANWWLRTPGIGTGTMLAYNHNYYGMKKITDCFAHTSAGVRLALWLDLNYAKTNLFLEFYDEIRTYVCPPEDKCETSNQNPKETENNPKVFMFNGNIYQIDS